MHDYSIDRHPKEKILFFLALAAILVTPVVNDTMSNAATYFGANTGWTVPLTAFPVFALFGGIYFAFDRYLWKWGWARKVLLVPDLNGTWVCAGQTTMKDGQNTTIDWSGRVTITQSWSKISIHLKTQHSESKSISASLFHEEGVGYRLLYQYSNNPNAKQLELSKHSGSTELLFAENCSTGEGHYFTDRHRRTVGTLKLERKKING